MVSKKWRVKCDAVPWHSDSSHCTHKTCGMSPVILMCTDVQHFLFGASSFLLCWALLSIKRLCCWHWCDYVHKHWQMLFMLFNTDPCQINKEGQVAAARHEQGESSCAWHWHWCWCWWQPTLWCWHVDGFPHSSRRIRGAILVSKTKNKQTHSLCEHFSMTGEKNKNGVGMCVCKHCNFVAILCHHNRKQKGLCEALKKMLALSCTISKSHGVFTTIAGIEEKCPIVSASVVISIPSFSCHCWLLSNQWRWQERINVNGSQKQHKFLPTCTSTSKSDSWNKWQQEMQGKQHSIVRAHCAVEQRSCRF